MLAALLLVVPACGDDASPPPDARPSPPDARPAPPDAPPVPIDGAIPPDAAPVTCDPASCTFPFVCAPDSEGCVCAPGYHLCGDACADNNSPASCGDSCTPCPDPPPNASSACFSGEDFSQFCGYTCNLGYQPCVSDCCAVPSAELVREFGLTSDVVYPVIDLDPENRPIVAFSTDPGQILLGVRTAPDTWSLRFITNILTIHSFDMAVDATGVIHLAYITDGNLDDTLVYERRTFDTVIERETVLVRDRLGTQVSLAFDASGTPSLVFVDGDTLSVARPGDPDWVTEPMVPAYFTSAFRHQVAANGDLHVLVREPLIPPTLFYGRFSNGVWSDEHEFDLLRDGRPPLVLDPDGAPAVVARGNGNPLTLWRYIQGTWTEEPIPVNGEPDSVALAFDGAGIPHVIYRQTFMRASFANYTFRRSAEVGWQTWTFASTGGRVSHDLTLTLDASATVHAAYDLFEPGALEYASW